MPNYIVTACYYSEVEIEAASESEAITKANRLFSHRCFIAPDEIAVEEIEEEEEEEEQ